MLPLSGRLHTYSTQYGALTAFESGNVSAASCVLFIAGLTEGYNGTPYIHRLSAQLEGVKWSLVQLHMRSSYTGYGTGSLRRDYEDMAACIEYLQSIGKRLVVLMGHSTGSQDSIHYVLNRPDKSSPPAVAGVIVDSLQAPVSDREFIQYKLRDSRWKDYVGHVSQMIKEGKENEMVPRSYWKVVGGAPCSAYRFNSLAGPDGDDDFFSSDLAETRLGDIWGHPAWASTPVLLFYGVEDQYVPPHVDKQAMIKKWELIYRTAQPESATSRSEFKLLSHANHELADERLDPIYVTSDRLEPRLSCAH